MRKDVGEFHKITHWYRKLHSLQFN